MDSIYDRALLEVGQNGIFQKKFDIIFNVVLVGLFAMAYVNIILALVITPHFCKLPEKPENISEHSWKMKYIPKLEDVTGYSKFSSCLIYINPDETNDTKACSEYTHDKTWYRSTVPSENNWVCDNEIYVANILAYIKIGETFGSLIFGWFGDRYGRRLTVIISLFLIIIGRLISIYTSTYYVPFVTGCIIASLPSWSVMQSTTIISIEISSPKRRTTTATLRFAAWSCGLCVMPFLYWWLKDWKLFLILTSITLIPFLLFSWKIIESPRWLWIEGKTKACVKELKRIGKANNNDLKSETEQQLLTMPAIAKTRSLGPLALFSGRKLALNTILQLIMWVSVTLNYTILLINSGENADGNPFLEFAWQSAAELPGNFLAAWLADKIGRRYSGVTSFAAITIIWILIICRETIQDGWSKIWWIGTTLLVINRLFTTVSYYTINLYNIELYPTCLRQSGMSLGNILSSGASAVAPYILHLGRQNDARIPGVVLIGVSVLGVISSFLLPETLNAKLPETLEDARAFGEQKKYFSVHMKPTQRKTSTEN